MTERNPEAFMREAVELSRRGFPAPNPRVGCVIVREGEVIGRGHHDHAGGPHAEAVALNEAGARARGSDVFVTLEPCNHQGRTGPCSEALVAAGVTSVTYAVADPNPRASGGSARLMQAGINVNQGVLANEATEVNRVFLTAMRLGRPFITVKAAMSLDGKIATLQHSNTSTPRPEWITGEPAREMGHILRAEMGAVLVGAGTVRADNPHLTARIEQVVNQPLRIILDPNDSLPKDAYVFTGPGNYYHVVSGEAPRSARPFASPECTDEDHSEIQLSLEHGHFPLDKLLQELWNRDITSVLVEGGGKTIGHFLSANLVDRLELFYAPIVIGQGISWSGDFSVDNLGAATRFTLRAARTLDNDIWVTADRI